MVFVREITKGAKTYRYLYKSKRIDGKVKSIYVGREEIKSQNNSKSKEISGKSHSKKKILRNSTNKIKKDDKWVIDKIIEFNNLMEESMDLVIQNKIEAAANHYNKLLNVYNKLSEIVSDDEKVKLYDKTKQIYDRIQEINSL